MKQLSFLIKPASSSCQLHCKYCFYNDVSNHREIKSNGIMKDDVMDHLIQEAFRVIDEGSITFAFQGGEPTMAGLSYFEKFIQTVALYKKNQTIQYAIQTNGMKLDDLWCSFFKKNNFLVGVSLDGYASNHDYFRLTHLNTPTHKVIMKGIEKLRHYRVDFNILTVLSNQLASSPEKLYRFYQDNDFNFIQLIPCLAGLDEEHNVFALTPKNYTSFYKTFFDLWYQDYINGHYRSVGLFDNLIPMLNGIPPFQCGMLGFCSLQYVVESDGNIYPCDFYVLDHYCGGNIMKDTLETIAQSSQMQGFLNEKPQVSKHCAPCVYYKLCYGNCQRTRSLYIDNQTCAYQAFLDYAMTQMLGIAKSLKNT